MRRNLHARAVTLRPQRPKLNGTVAVVCRYNQCCIHLIRPTTPRALAIFEVASIALPNLERKLAHLWRQVDLEQKQTGPTLRRPQGPASEGHFLPALQEQLHGNFPFPIWNHLQTHHHLSCLESLVLAVLLAQHARKRISKR